MALSVREIRLLHQVLGPLEDIGLITLDETKAEKCCGIARDEQGRCNHRPGHPVYVRLPEEDDAHCPAQAEAPLEIAQVDDGYYLQTLAQKMKKD